jgi:hypothetical protein
MYCKTCGNQIDNDSKFCSFCGSKQSDVNKPSVNCIDLPTESKLKTTNENLSFGIHNINKPTQEIKQVEYSKYDSTYTPESHAKTVGVILLLISLLFAINSPIKFDSVESYNQFKFFLSFVALVLRIFVIKWVVAIAKRQNRETFGWGILAFFLPSITLIIIGILRKKNVKLEIDNNLSKKENSRILSDKAQKYFNENKYYESILFSKRAIELNAENEKAKTILNNTIAFIEPVFSQTKSEDFLEIVARYTDEELLTIINVRRNSYAPTFLTAVEEEIRNRDLHNI